MLNSSYDLKEPKIVKAKFFIGDRIYSLDFDQNLEMKELKYMIEKAAHLRRKTIRLFYRGKEYTQYNDETFESLFPNQYLVEFQIELGEGEEDFDETELLLQISSCCNEHSHKFLLYYCFTCNTSICSDCFTNGKHVGHQIQDKCLYLMQSKYLVEKMFSNWSQRPYQEYQISVDLSEFKNKVNNVMFDELFKMLQKVKEKCNLLIDEYNKVNQSSLGNIRDSVRDIKVSCTKALDNLKEELNIKDIINNQDIFVEFDLAYKELGKKQNEKFKQNLVAFQELNKQVSTLVSNLVQQTYTSIYNTLNEALNEQKYNDVKSQINQKFIKPADKNDILSQMSEQKKKRKTALTNSNFVKTLAQQVQKKLNSEQGKNLNNIPNNSSDNINVNPFVSLDKVSISNTSNQNENNITTNPNPISNDAKVNFGFVEKPLGQNQVNYTPLNNNIKFGSNNVDNITITENNISISNQDNLVNNNNPNLDINYSAQVQMPAGTAGPYSSAQVNRQVISTETIPIIKTNNFDFSTGNNNNTQTQINQFGISPSNINKRDSPAIQIGVNNNINSQMIPTNPQQTQIYKTIKTKTTTYTEKTFVPNIINHIADNNGNKTVITSNNNFNNILNNSNQGNQNTTVTYKIEMPTNNYGNNFSKQKNDIIEEMSESENEMFIPADIKKFLNTEYILAPIPQTNSIKIFTENTKEERTLSLKFPADFHFNTFFLDCAYCNCTMNKCLYISGGIESTSEQKRSNALLCVDISKPDELKVTKKASMNFERCAHTMVSDNKYIYVAGGEDLNSVERYDIENDVWEILPSMICKRMYPILFIYKGYLYAFFGKYKNGDYPCSIERLNMNSNTEIAKPNWELIMFSNQNNLELNYYGCGVHEINGLLYFFGGKCNEESTDQIFFYNFESKYIEREDSDLLWKEYFRENKLHKLGQTLVQCCESNYFGVYISLQEE